MTTKRDIGTWSFNDEDLFDFSFHTFDTPATGFKLDMKKIDAKPCKDMIDKYVTNEHAKSLMIQELV